MGTALLILLLLALCGFIAYIGDLLGRRFGKKRLTLFGLRPKHTAIILTIATGVLIAGVTFGFALLVVPGFRQAVTQGERLVGQNARLREAAARRTAENARLGSENARLADSNGTLARANGDLNQNNAKLKQTNVSLEKQSQELSAKNGELTHANGELQGHNNQLRTANTSLTAANSRLTAEQATLQRTMGELKREIVGLKTVAANYRQEQYIYRRDEPIDQSVILKNTPPELLRTTVVNLLYSATTHASEHGARSTADHKALYLAPPEGYPRSLPLKDASIRDWLIQKSLAYRDKPQFWRVVAHENAIAGKPVPARLEWYTNDRIFNAGQLVKAPGIGCWWPVDGSKASEGSIIGELVYFLKAQVTNTARARHMVPNQDGFVGEVNYDHLIEVSRKLKEIDRPAVVVAYARQNTDRSGPLHVDLKPYPADALPDEVRQAIQEAANEGARR